MDNPRHEHECVLPIGHTDPDGRIHRRAVLRKMTGREELLIYDPTLPDGRLVTELIRSCLVRLGSLEPIGADLASRLYTADRNYLLLELRRITLGDRLRASYVCPSCEKEVAVIEDLGELPVNRLGEGEALEDMVVDLEDGYLDREGNVHRDLVLTLPRGIDEEFVAPAAEKDPWRAQDALVLRCIKRFGSLPKSSLEAYGIKILRELTMGDRQRLRAAFDERAPGVDFRRSLRCDGCGTQFDTLLDVGSFFFGI